MPFKFTTLPYDLQYAIAKKLDCWTFTQLQLSSKSGRILESAYCSVVLEVDILFVDSRSMVRFVITNPLTGKSKNHLWNTIRKYPHRQIFLVKCIRFWPTCSFEQLDQVAEEINFVPNKSTIWWKWGITNQEKVFLKFSQILNFTRFDIGDCNGDITDIVQLPQFQKLTSVVFHHRYYAGGYYPSENLFLALKATTIRCRFAPELDTATTLNEFFRQWIDKDREIFSMKFILESEITSEDIMKDLPFSLVYSAKSCSYKTAHDCINTYLLDRGDKRLEVTKNHNQVIASIIEDYSAFEKKINELLLKDDIKSIKDYTNEVQPRRRTNVMTKYIRDLYCFRKSE